jgi:proteasome accessory factor C
VSTSASRLERLLALVPYLLAHPGTPLPDLARTFGVPVRQLRQDLNLIFLCGLPGHTPGDLIEVWFGPEDTVSVTNADTIARPLRLTTDEALALVVALRTLADVPAADGDDAVQRALAKIETAAGEAAEQASRIAVTVEAEPEMVAAARGALSRSHRVRLSYYVPGRDEITERDVDPMRLLVTSGRTYLQGWCHRAIGMRTFRTDRIVALTELDTPAAPPPDAGPPSDTLFAPSDQDRLVTLRLEPRARWVSDYYPCESVTEAGDGRLLVTLRSRESRWLVRLALRLGSQATVVGPDALAAEVRGEAAAALAAYAPGWP